MTTTTARDDLRARLVDDVEASIDLEFQSLQLVADCTEELVRIERELDKLEAIVVLGRLDGKNERERSAKLVAELENDRDYLERKAAQERLLRGKLLAEREAKRAGRLYHLRLAQLQGALGLPAHD